MGNMNDYLQKRAAELDLDRGDQLVAIQAHFEQLYPSQCRAVSINDGLLRVVTPNASVASELRLSQTRLLAELTPFGVQKVIIKIGAH